MKTLRLLGGLRAADDRGPRPLPGAVPHALLGCLALRPAAPVAREHLAGLLWPEATPDRAGPRLSDALYRLQRALGPGWIAAEGASIALAPGVWVDVREFERLSAAADPAALEQAVALYAGDLLPEVYADWALAPRVHLREQVLDCLLRLGQRAEDRQEPGQALAHFQRLAHADPLREDAGRGVMRALARLGRLPEALDAYAQLAARLQSELAAAPHADTQTLAEALRRELELASAPGDAPSEPAFIGRAAERAQLLARLDRARAGQGGLVVVLGDAGIGKTRLLEELIRAADWRGWQVARGGGEALGTPAAYAPLSAALAAALPRPRRQQVAELVAPAWLALAGVVVPALAEGAPLPPDPDPVYLPAALGRVLAALGQVAPHLFLLDDAHWADPALWPLLDGLRAALADSPVLVVLAARASDARDQPGLWDMLQAWDRAGEPVIQLAGLSRAELAQLAQAGAGPGLDPSQLERLETASGGNPLLALALLETATPDRPLQPRSLADLFQRRLDALLPAARLALEAAAVAGYRFEYGLWQAVLGPDLPEAASLPRLAGELEQARLIVLEAEGYRFAHDTLRAHVHAGLGDDARAALHGRALSALAAAPVPAAARLYHAEQAGLAEAVVVQALAAGQEALDRFAFAAARDFFSRALAAAPPAAWPDRYAAVLGRVRAREALSDRDPQPADLALLADLAERLADPARQAEALYRQALYHWQAGDFPPAEQASAQGLRLAQQAHAPGLEARLLETQGRVARDQGRYAEARAALKAALVLHQAGGEGAAEARTLELLGAVTQRQGAARKAITYARAALARHQSLGNLFGEARGAGSLGIALWQAGDYAEARASFERSLALSRDTGDRRAQAAALSNLGGLAATLGDLARAQSLLDEVLGVWRALGNLNGAAATLGNLGELAYDRGDHAGALSRFDEALTLNRQLNRPRGEAYALAGRGRALLALGRPAEARAALEAAAALRARLGERDNLAQTQSFLALACLSADDLPAAQTALDAALAALDPRQHSPAVRRDVHYAAHRVMAAVGQPVPAAAHLQSAEAALLEMAADLPLAARTAFLRLPDNARLRQSLAASARRVTAHLPPAGGAPGRRAALVAVEWTVWAPSDEHAPPGAPRRRRVLARLLDEAAALGAAPTAADLAAALGVSRRTILRDLAALRRSNAH